MQRILRASRAADAIDAEGVYGRVGEQPTKMLAVFKELGASAVPYLLAVLDDDELAYWAAGGLAAIGPDARSASAAVERRVQARPQLAGTLFCIDPQRALELGLHERPQTQRAVFEAAQELAPTDFGRLLTAMLQSSKPDVVRRALEDGLSGWSSRRLARERPDLLPLALVRAHARGPNAEAANAVLAALPVERPVSSAAPDVEGGAAHLEPWQLYALLRRRRCAGLRNDPALATRALRGAGQAQDLHALAWVLSELEEDVEAALAALLRTPWAPAEGFDPVLLLLGKKGAAGLALLDSVIAGVPGDERARMNLLRERLVRWQRPGWTTLDGADARYLAGAIETLEDRPPHTPGDNAWEAYAAALLFDPHCAPAALQLARLDRGFGAPITPERIAFLRSLGVVNERLLTELATPVIPLTAAHPRLTSRPLFDEDLARREEAAGFPSLAATCLVGRDEDTSRLGALAQRQVDVARSACLRR
jgi:hypothetical protein